MTYNKPELEVKKFDIVDEITAEGDSAAVNTESANGKNSSSASVAAENSIGSDLIIG